jgi:hypothetical protein
MSVRIRWQGLKPQTFAILIPLAAMKRMEQTLKRRRRYWLSRVGDGESSEVYRDADNVGEDK